MFYIDSRSKEPIFEQIKKQIVRYVNLGIMQQDDKLPSVRTLAGELGINPNTVAKAYLELEAIDIVYSIPKKGVFVAANCNVEEFTELLKDLDSIVSKCYQSKVEIEKIKNVIDKYYGGEKDA